MKKEKDNRHKASVPLPLVRDETYSNKWAYYDWVKRGRGIFVNISLDLKEECFYMNIAPEFATAVVEIIKGEVSF